MSDIAKEDCLRRQIDTLNGKRGGQLIANCDRSGFLESIRNATSKRREYGKGKKSASVAKNCRHGKGV